MCATCSTYEDYELVAFAGGKGSGKGKGKGGKSSFPPRQNPMGADGEIMKCSTCGSSTHLRRFCKVGGAGGGKGSGHSSGKGEGAFPAAHLSSSAQSSALHSSSLDMSASGPMNSMNSHMQPGSTSAPSWFSNAIASFSKEESTSVSQSQGFFAISVFDELNSKSSVSPQSLNPPVCQCYHSGQRCRLTVVEGTLFCANCREHQCRCGCSGCDPWEPPPGKGPGKGSYGSGGNFMSAEPGFGNQSSAVFAMMKSVNFDSDDLSVDVSKYNTPSTSSDPDAGYWTPGLPLSVSKSHGEKAVLVSNRWSPGCAPYGRAPSLCSSGPREESTSFKGTKKSSHRSSSISEIMASEIKNPSERSSELQLVEESKPTSHSLLGNFTTP